MDKRAEPAIFSHGFAGSLAQRGDRPRSGFRARAQGLSKRIDRARRGSDKKEAHTLGFLKG